MLGSRDLIAADQHVFARLFVVARVAPDIEVEMTPKQVISGKDPQLERAVQEALRLLEAQPFEMKPEPPAPVRWKRPEGFKK